METVAADQYPWLKFYPEGVPHVVNPDAYPSLIDLMEEAFKNFRGASAYSNMGKELTFGEIDELSRNFAAYLQSLGLQKGDRIAIQMPNLLQYPIAMFGALRAGLAVVNTNPLYTPREMQHQFRDAGVKAIVILANFAVNLEKIVATTSIKHIIITQVGDMMGFPKRLIVNAVVKYIKKMVPSYNLPDTVSFSSALAQGKDASYNKPIVTGADLSFIQYTGGTTGVSKGAMLTHRNLVANTMGNYEWLKPGMKKMKSGNQPILVAALPLYHVFALTVNAFLALKCGGMNLLITNPRDMNAFISDLKKYKINIFTGLNTLFNGLLNNPAFKEVDCSELVITSAGGMAVQKVVAERWFEVTGCQASEGYGLTETSPVLSSNPLSEHNRIGTIGIPLPSTEMKIRGEDDRWVGPGERGEICASGPQIMLGYFEQPEETAKVLFEEEGKIWFRTGDIGIMDEDGFFKIVDRKKDMILVSGFNVYPNEIEDVVAQCPGVLEVACLGVPDERSTEAVKVFVVKKDPSLTEDQIKKHCRANELPKTNVGKILRRALREN
jgi:long-chain acyl-CoA synthetase